MASRVASKFKPRVCCWEDVSYANAKVLLDPEFPQQTMQNLLVQILGLPLNEEKQLDKHGLITLELFGYLVLFARENDFTPEQLSALYTIVASIHQLCLSTPYDNSQQCFQLLKDLLVCHSVNRPPYSTGLFSVKQVKSISDYVLLSYFKHFKLYKYAFTKKVHLDLTFQYEGVVDTPLSSQTELAPTDEAVGGERTDGEEADGIKDKNVVEVGDGRDEGDNQIQDKNGK